jgi:hypothetical protein
VHSATSDLTSSSASLQDYVRVMWPELTHKATNTGKNEKKEEQEKKKTI